MSKSDIKKSGFFRIVAVLLGVFGAGWLFSSVWRTVFDQAFGYRLGTNFFSYFFGTGLLSVATLFVATLFFVVSLRDLEPIRNVFSIITAVISIVAFLAYIAHVFEAFSSLGYIITPAGIIDVGNLVLLVAYFLYSLYARNGGSIRGTAWIFSVVGIIILLVGALYGYLAKDFGAQTTIDYIISSLAHVALFYCGLREY